MKLEIGKTYKTTQESTYYEMDFSYHIIKTGTIMLLLDIKQPDENSHDIEFTYKFLFDGKMRWIPTIGVGRLYLEEIV